MGQPPEGTEITVGVRLTKTRGSGRGDELGVDILWPFTVTGAGRFPPDQLDHAKRLVWEALRDKYGDRYDGRKLNILGYTLRGF
jgi:hypothetical protein